MHIENGKMVYGMRECSRCWGTSKIASQITCRTCKGSGNGKRGGKGQCKACYGSKHEYDHVNKVTCPECGGLNSSASQVETAYDTMPQDVWQSLEFRVIRTTQRQTWADQYLALGCVYSVTDYGRHQNLSDEALIEVVRSTSGHQACKVVKDDGTVASYIAIITTDGGYKPVAIFDNERTHS